MKKKLLGGFLSPICLFLLFLLFTALVMTLDVKPVGPVGSEVGLSELNRFVSERVGVHFFWYHLTDILGYVAILTGLGFAALGLYQWIKRKSLAAVDRDLIVLGSMYILLGVIYVVFEVLTINYRPVLMDGELDPSYPSSHTLLALACFAMAISQIVSRVQKKALRRGAVVCLVLLMIVAVAGRILSGVHWITDIIAGILLSTVVISLYNSLICRFATAPKEN